MNQKSPENITAMKEVFHNACDKEFKDFVSCYHKVSMKKAVGKAIPSNEKCVGEGNRYLHCFEKNMKNVILSSIQNY